MTSELGDDDHRPVQRPAIILVEPQLGENIGTAARAMANFGLVELRLVNPRDRWPSENARAAASGANSVVDSARCFDRLDDAVGDLSFVYATTARIRGLPKGICGPREAAEMLRARGGSGQRTGILFGREKWGLTNEELALADEIVTFPVNPRFASLNLAQAVLLMSYEWMSSGLAAGELPARLAVPRPDFAPAPKSDLIGLMQHLERALEPTGYFRSPDKKATMVANLRALLQRPGFTRLEIRVLRGVVSAFAGRRDRVSDKSSHDGDEKWDDASNHA